MISSTPGEMLQAKTERFRYFKNQLLVGAVLEGMGVWSSAFQVQRKYISTVGPKGYRATKRALDVFCMCGLAEREQRTTENGHGREHYYRWIRWPEPIE